MQKLKNYYFFEEKELDQYRHQWISESFQDQGPSVDESHFYWAPGEIPITLPVPESGCGAKNLKFHASLPRKPLNKAVKKVSKEGMEPEHQLNFDSDDR